MSLMEESAALRKAIVDVIRDELPELTRDCVRAKKAIVDTRPSASSGTCAVKLIGDDRTLYLPYSSAVSSVEVGDVVWVLILYGSMRNAIVWETADFR